MSDTFNQIKEDLKQAMLAKNVFVRDTLRLVTSEIKRFEVDNRVEVTQEDIVAILKRMAKQRKDSIEQYMAGARADLAEVEQKELDLINQYLPESLSGAALKGAVKTIIEDLGLSEMKDMGQAMKEIKLRHPDAEMSEASSAVKELLS